VDGKDYPAVKNLSALSDPKTTGVSIITHPAITIGVLKEAAQIGVPSVWLQPGTWDDDVLKFAKEEGKFEAVVYGEGGRGHGGWCVLVDGEKAMKDAGKL
jgi:predicted CoA-binding protein